MAATFPILNRRSSKPSQTSAMPHIAAALMPPLVFIAVPDTPAPQPVPGVGLGLSSSLLNTTAIGRMFGTPVPADEEPFSEPESSMYDYEHMEEPGYSSVQFGKLQQNRLSMSDRPRARTPSPRQISMDDEGDQIPKQMEQSPGGLYHVLDPSERLSESRGDVYATPNKGAIKKKHVTKGIYPKQSPNASPEMSAPRSHRQSEDIDESPASLHHSLGGTTRDVREAMMRLGNLDDDDQRIPVNVEQLNEVESQIVKAQVSHVSASPGLRKKRERTPIISGSAPPGFNLNDAPEQQQEQELSSLGKSGSPRLTPEHDKLVRSVNEMNQTLKMENYELRNVNNELHEEIATLHKVTTVLHDGDEEGARSLLYKKSIQDMKEEMDTLKTSCHKLNIELSKYQAKHRPLDKDINNIAGLPSKGPIPSWLINTRYLAPLFLAYDDELLERNNIIRKYEEELIVLRNRTDAIVKENQRLHIMASPDAGAGGPLSAPEWQQMKEQARLVLEENQILMEQVKVQQDKSRDMCDARLEQVSKITKKFLSMESEKNDLELEVEDVRKKYRDLRQKYDELLLKSEGNVSVHDHINAVNELKRSFIDVKENYKKELDNQSVKLQAMQMERKNLVTELSETGAENRKLSLEVKAFHKALRKSQEKMIKLQRSMETTDIKEYGVHDHLTTLIKLAEKTAFERDTYAKVAKDQEHETQKAMKRLLQGNISVGKMEEKLKTCKLKAAAKVHAAGIRLNEQDAESSRQAQEYEREIKHLRLLLKEKESLIYAVSSDKKQVEDDLEIMWQAANSENRLMQASLQKSIQKGRQSKESHEPFEEDSDHIGLSSDSDK